MMTGFVRKLISPGQISRVKQELIPFLFRLRGGRDLYASSDDLAKYGIELITRSPACRIDVPAVTLNDDDAAREHIILPSVSVDYSPCQVMRLDYATHGDCVRRWGAIVLPGGVALQTGANYHMPRLAAITPRPIGRRRREALIVAPWPHTFMGYGDFCMCVLPRVCRALSVLTERERAAACVALPFSRGDWSRQYLEILGISRDRQIDTLTENFGLAKGGEVVTVCDNAGVWAPPGDLKDLQTMIPPPDVRGKRRFMIQRKGARPLQDEEKLFASIKDLGFELLEDTPRTVREQIAIFREAECVVGPHGAGLSNVLWGGPGIRLMEVQSISWMIPSFRYLCAIRHSPYQVAIDDSDGGKPRTEAGRSGLSLSVDSGLFRRHVRTLCEASV